MPVDPYQGIEERLIRIFNKLESMDGQLHEIDRNVAMYNVELDRQADNTKRNGSDIKMISSDMKHVKNHVAMVKGGFRVIGFAGIGVSVLLGIMKIMGVV